MVSPIVHFQIASPNPERMREFLSEVFGWEISQGALADIPYGIDTGWADDIVVSGSILGVPQGQGFTTVFVRVDDLDATLARASSRGAIIRVPRTRLSDGQDIAIIAHVEGQSFGVVQK